MCNKDENVNEGNIEIEENVDKSKSISKKSKVLITKKEIVAILLLTFVLSAIMILLEIFIYNGATAKPIIYLYPTSETEVSVELGNPEAITCSYPKYEESWNVLAKPSGDLLDLKTGRSLYSLYLEGKSNNKKDITEGFCVRDEDSAKFLEEKLSILGLSNREAEEFIVYCLPKLERNKYNIICFKSMDEINDYIPLNISPTPDSLIRIMMIFRGVNEFVNIPEQDLTTPPRFGFVVVEWGGSEIK